MNAVNSDPKVADILPADGPHLELQKLRLQLKEIYQAMAMFGPSVPKPPILDSSVHSSGRASTDALQDSVPGLRALRDSVRRDLDVLEKFLSDAKCASLPPLSTNAPYLIAVWHEVLLAPQPIMTIWKTYTDGERPAQPRNRGSQKPPGVKVDVVADNGRQWMRVNTVKNSRILAEFRELDSYLTDSDNDSAESTHTAFDNSLLRMGRALITAARHNPIPGTIEPPRIVLRLTRLDPSPSDEQQHDLRIAQTIQELQEMGIDVQLGERDVASLPSASAQPPRLLPHGLEPTSSINLDLSILIALVSDITHAPLPRSAEEAESRFVPPLAYREWKAKRIQASKGTARDPAADDPGLPDWADGAGKHSRALAHQAQQEMRSGLLQEIHDRLAALAPGAPRALAHVEFWTTREARDRCLRIVLSKIGGPDEQRRVRALFPDPLVPPVDRTEAEDAYWLHSRYPRGFVPLLPIHVFPASGPDEPHERGLALGGGERDACSPFFGQLERTCQDLLARETVPHPSTTQSESVDVLGGAVDKGERHEAHDPLLESGTGDEEIQRASVLRANSKLTAHTVESLLWGARLGWTTLTANKTSVKAIVREVQAGETDAWGARGERCSGEKLAVEKAAVWVVDPRSLAEGMRSDHGQ